MAKKLYHFNMRKNEHNINLALSVLFNRHYDAVEAGDAELADKLWAKREEIYGAYERAGFYAGGMAEVEWPDWVILHEASEGAKAFRAEACAAHGIEYVE